MILLREIQERDVSTLESLAQIPGFINLPSEPDLILEKIKRSQKSFKSTSTTFDSEAKFIFVAEDLSNKRVLGTAMVASQHGSVDSPHFYFEVGQEQKFSSTINTGFIHGTLKLKYDTNGPAELGGLVVDPEYRNNDVRVGRQISFVRFLYMATHRNRFKKKLLAELLPPLNRKGESPLWEAIGRRFTNMNYWEADLLCQKNKEFIFSLFPSGKIYTTFLDAESREAIGKVSKDTEPVMHMLKKIGFQYKGHVDPFDGGPHLWAELDQLGPVRKTKKMVLKEVTLQEGESIAGLICSTQEKPGEFRALSVTGVIHGDQLEVLSSELKQLRQVLELNGDAVYFMPYY